MYVKLSAGDIGLMDSLQELTLADLFHLPYGAFIFDGLKLGGLERRPHLKR